MKLLLFLFAAILSSCNENVYKDDKVVFTTIDTDFSKGRLSHVQHISLNDLEKFHGHMCDGLVLGALAMKEAMKMLYLNDTIDRTNLRIVSKPSPCLTDVAVYLTGSRYQFNTFYVDTYFEGLYIIQRIDNLQAVSINLIQGVKPIAIDSLGHLAIKNQLSACGLDSLRKLEDDFTALLFRSNPVELFSIKVINDFEWKPEYKTFIKSDILNKEKKYCDQQ